MKSQKIIKKVETVFTKTGLTSGEQEVGVALVTLAEKLDECFFHRLDFILPYLVSKKIINVPQIEAVCDYIKLKGKDLTIEIKDFEESVGVGVEVTEKDIQNSINKHFELKMNILNVERYKFKYINILHDVKKDFKYLDLKLARELLIKTFDKLLGGKTKEELEEDSVRDNYEKLKEKKKLVKDQEKKKKEVSSELKWDKDDEAKLEQLNLLIKEYDRKFEEKIKNSKLTIEEEELESDKLSKIMGRNMSSALNSEEQMKKHLEFTKGLVYTRFPPEPNGYLHIGHAKAMRFSFNSALKQGGKTYLRFDDTNPDKENNEFIENIKENVEWLGYKPFMITHASDNFEKLYDLAVELIKRGKAYVCHLSKEDTKIYRENGTDSPYRNRSVEENLELFENMRNGKYKEKECCLRMKIDMKHPNTVMRDPAAYRIKYMPHPHAGDKWCIYPTYDFTHSICDSLENITHSLCTLEFEIRRDNYYWLLDALDLYKPFVWEYSRLNITHFVMSKRKLQLLVENKIVRGWDDPRMPTINGLRRKGYTAEAINHFVDSIGVTRRGNENFISYKVLENSAKISLDKTAPRTMAVLDPIEVEIINLDKDQIIETPKFPKSKELGNYKVTLTNRIFIERSDFKEDGNDDYFGLTLKQEVGLKYAGILNVVEVVKDSDGNILKLKCKYSPEEKKTKGRIHWISSSDAQKVEARWYELFFKSTNPNSLDNFIEDINPDNEKIYSSALMNGNIIKEWKLYDKFQFERLGYFVIDKDSTNDKLVLNLTVKL